MSNLSPVWHIHVITSKMHFEHWLNIEYNLYTLKELFYLHTGNTDSCIASNGYLIVVCQT